MQGSGSHSVSVRRPGRESGKTTRTLLGTCRSGSWTGRVSSTSRLGRTYSFFSLHHYTGNFTSVFRVLTPPRSDRSDPSVRPEPPPHKPVLLLPFPCGPPSCHPCFRTSTLTCPSTFATLRTQPRGHRHPTPRYTPPRLLSKKIRLRRTTLQNREPQHDPSATEPTGRGEQHGLNESRDSPGER